MSVYMCLCVCVSVCVTHVCMFVNVCIYVGCGWHLCRCDHNDWWHKRQRCAPSTWAASGVRQEQRNEQTRTAPAPRTTVQVRAEWERKDDGGRGKRPMISWASAIAAELQWRSTRCGPATARTCACRPSPELPSSLSPQSCSRTIPDRSTQQRRPGARQPRSAVTSPATLVLVLQQRAVSRVHNFGFCAMQMYRDRSGTRK